MAKFEMGGIEDLIQQLGQMEYLDEIATKMLDAATPILAENLSKNIRAATDRGYATGELEKSVKPGSAKKNAYGHFAAVRPTGTDKKGIRNGEKLAYLEYGTSTQTAHPVMAKTVNESEAECLNRMQEVFNREVGG